MNTTPWTAPRAAHRLTHILDTYAAAHGIGRFPVNVSELALSCSNIFGWTERIEKVDAATIRGFEGALFPIEDKKSWLLLYNNSLRSQGRIRFTQAHELGHFILHRSLRESFECSEQDMLDWTTEDQSFESQADEFASHLLMPLNDFRQQINAPVNLDLMGHCAERYGVSLTAAILKWLSFTNEKALVVMSRDGYMNWAWASQPAFKAGAFFRTKRHVTAIPSGSIASNENITSARDGIEVPAAVWFSHAEPQWHVKEMKLYSDHYDCVITLLILPHYANVWAPRPFEDD